MGNVIRNFDAVSPLMVIEKFDWFQHKFHLMAIFVIGFYFHMNGY